MCIWFYIAVLYLAFTIGMHGTIALAYAMGGIELHIPPLRAPYWRIMAGATIALGLVIWPPC